MRRILAQARKELRQVSRDRLTLTLALILPLLLLALNGSAISLTVENLPIVVQDLDSSDVSRRLIDAFRSSLTFQIVELAPGTSPETPLLENKARAALIIPPGFADDLNRGKIAETQILVDASDANTANVLRGSSTAVIRRFGASLLKAEPKLPIKPNIRFWFNPGLDSQLYIVPSMLAVGLALFPPLLAALAMSREGEQKTILQVYVSSISAGEYLLGKIVAYFVIAFAEWVLCLILAYFLFGIGLRGDPSALFVCTVLYLLTNVCFGAMVGAAIPNQAAAIQAVQIVGFLLSYLLSGAIFPISNIPQGIRWLSNIIPARYYIEVVRDSMVRGSGWSGLWLAPFAISAIGCFFFLVAWLKMRRMQLEA
ncbi:MAG: ABC transporter permease [Pyrinomonadaceae bacterium]